MKRALLLFLIAPTLLLSEAGIIVPDGQREPDPAKLSLDEMEIRVRIDNGLATVFVKQIFANHTAGVMEGSYTFSLPARALISDFAVWDGVTRIPGVILERRRAEELYAEAKAHVIDPGLLQQGERDVDEARRTSVFSARIVPIPAYGTKRVEMEYQERIPVEQMQSLFAIPLRPDAYRAVTVGRLRIEVDLQSPHVLSGFETVSAKYPLTVRERSANRIRADLSVERVTLNEDFAIKYTLDAAKKDTLAILAHRENTTEPGFFEASALVGDTNAPISGAARNIVALFDVSLSMQWEKLERSYLALEKLLRSLRPVDRFHLLLFNSEVTAFAPQPSSQDAIDKALEFVKASRLRGGTDLQKALTAAIPVAAAPESYIVILTDGSLTRGAEIRSSRIAQWYANKTKARTYVFAVGDDANISLLTQLAGDRGVVEWVRSTEPVDFKLNAFLSKIGRRSLEQVSLQTQPSSNVQHVYPLEASVFPASMQWWVGQYQQPGKTTFTVQARRENAPLELQASINLPATATDHPHLPRAWAKARVDALLEKIDRDGEDRATIDEIIRLARKYKFVTPYTSFLAAPRSLLRPRLIRPGDPVLRVRTDQSISSVVAMFPFGLVKPLRFLKDEDIWQTRFLAPADMPDGTHTVRLILRDRQGRTFRESKTFVIASKPPTVRVKLEKTRYKRGEVVELRVGASETSRTVVARMYGMSPVSLRWNSEAKANTGQFIIPTHLPAGRYSLTVTAEDFAHNIGREEVSLEVVP
ncbi:MAG TPA: VIT domain-containing protein [Bryobacteraceae bacterium]|nr:VIT domain-containing protein [Bryobacteraceae bacterium]